VVVGGDGADFVSGDLGDDTMTGGAGRRHLPQLRRRRPRPRHRLQPHPGRQRPPRPRRQLHGKPAGRRHGDRDHRRRPHGPGGGDARGAGRGWIVVG
jgi:hypothetical protein